MWVSQSFLLALSAHCSIRAKKEGRYRELERGGLNRKQNAFFEHKNKQKKTAYYKEQNPKNETETQDGGSEAHQGDSYRKEARSNAHSYFSKVMELKRFS